MTENYGNFVDRRVMDGIIVLAIKLKIIIAWPCSHIGVYVAASMSFITKQYINLIYENKLIISKFCKCLLNLIGFTVNKNSRTRQNSDLQETPD